MGFDLPGAAYDRFMGRYSEPLAHRFLAWLGPRVGRQVLEVGCGPGALTARLTDLLGAGAVQAVDPSEQFLESLRLRLPDVATRRATADHLPFPDDAFDSAVAQLVVHFLPDPVAGLVEMKRVTRADGWVAVSTWDLAGGRAPISPMWRAARDLDPSVRGEEMRPGTARGELASLLTEAGLAEVSEAELVVTVKHPTFEEWWEPYLLGVGPAGDYVAGLDDEHRTALRERCRELLPTPPFAVDAVVWAARGRA
jgi:SAM-dependent methyltransferase